MATFGYTVKAGDSLSKIAAHYTGRGFKGVTWQGIASRNNIKSPYVIKSGQKLIIPYTAAPATKPVQGPSPTGPVTGGNLNSGGSSGGAGYGNAFNPEPMVNKVGGFIILYGFFKVLMKVF